MAALKSPRYERYAQNIARGLTQSASAIEAGYSPSSSQPSILIKKPEIRARIEELQQERSEVDDEVSDEFTEALKDLDTNGEISHLFLIRRLMQIQEKAYQIGNYTASHRAVQTLCQIANLIKMDTLSAQKAAKEQQKQDAAKSAYKVSTVAPHLTDAAGNIDPQKMSEALSKILGSAGEAPAPDKNTTAKRKQLGMKRLQEAQGRA